MKQKYKYKLYISYEGGPMNRLVRLLVKCPDRHNCTSNAQMNNEKRCSANNSNGFYIYLSIQPFALRFFGHGTFGWTATRVHEKIVTRQL